MSKAVIEVNVLKRLLNATRKFVSGAERREVMRYIKLEFKSETNIVKAVASDNFSLSVEYGGCVECENDFIAYIKPTLTLAGKSFVYIELIEDELFLRYDGMIQGFKQPEGDFINDEEILAPINNELAAVEITFNAALMERALQAVKASAGGVLKSPVTMEYRGVNKPVVLREAKSNIKLVMPMRANK